MGVAPQVWQAWECGAKRPDLANAIALEWLTDGHVKIERWGYDMQVLLDALVVIKARKAEARRATKRTAKGVKL